MTATARIAADKLAVGHAGPGRNDLPEGRPPRRLRLNGSKFDETSIDIVRRGREQAAVSDGVKPGDKLAVRRPEADLIRRKG